MQWVPPTRSLRILFEAVLADYATLGGKLDLDAGVTDTDFAAKLADPKKSAGLTK